MSSTSKLFNSELEISINGVNFSEKGCVLIECKTEEYVPYYLPLAEVSLSCTDPTLLKNIYDGSEVLIKYKVDNKQSSLLKYRIMMFKITPSINYILIKFSCYFDISSINFSKYFSINSTSSEVAKYIAGVANMSYDISTTNDKQTWICYGKTLFDFLIDISYNSWADSTSGICACFSNNKLKFINIVEQIQKPPKVKFIDNYENLKEKDQLVYESLNIISDSAVNNQIAGYGISGNNFSVETGNFNNIYSDIKFKSVTDKVNINSDLVKIQRSESMSLNCGNTHANYHRAELQNLRIKSLFSVKIEIVTQMISNLELLDPVEVNVSNVSNDINLMYSGKYIIERIRRIRGKNSEVYFIYDLCRSGFNLNNPKDNKNVKLK